MGKSQKQRSQRRHNPVRVPDSHLSPGLAAASSTSSKTEAVLPIIQKLESSEPQERTWACAAVSNLIQNDPSTRRLLQGKNVVGALIGRLSDTVEEVVAEAAGALRNLCIDGGYDICAEMYNKNILPPLKAFIPKISSNLAQFLSDPTSSPSNTHLLVCQFAENVITILWCLSETSNKALNAINDIALVPFLMAFLVSRNRLPPSTVTAAAQCLYVLSEENDVAIQELRMESAYVSCLINIVEQEDDNVITLRVLTCGILRNVSPLPALMTAASLALEQTIILPLLIPVLSVSLQDCCTRVLTLMAQTEDPEIQNLTVKHAPKPDHKSAPQLELEGIENKLRTVQLSLEILTGLCAQLPEPEPASEAELQDVDEEWEDAEMQGVPDGATEAVQGSESYVTSQPLMTALLVPLMALLHPTPLSFAPPSSLSAHPPTTAAMGLIHICALECLNNLFLSLGEGNANPQQGAQVWSELWAVLAEVGLVQGIGPVSQKKREVWEIGVGVLWGIARACNGHLVPDSTEVKLLMDLCDATEDEGTKVKCIGTLECLAQHRNAIEANGVISGYLLKYITSTQIEPMIQSLSALIDIYSDEDSPYDINFRQGGFLGALNDVQAHIKRTVKTIDKRKAGGMELRRRGNEVYENLVAFVKYRKNLRL